MKKLLLGFVLVLVSFTVFGQPAATGTLTNNNDTVPATGQPALQSQGTVGVSITGSFTMTVNFEVSVDNINWFAAQAINTSTGVAATTTTTTGLYQVSASGARVARVRASGASAGSASVSMYSWFNASAKGGGGGGGGGLSNPVTTAQGGFGINASASTGIPQLTAGVTSISTLPFNSSLLTGVGNTANGFLGINTSGTGSPGFLAHENAAGTWSVGALTATDVNNLNLDFTQYFCWDEFLYRNTGGTGTNIYGPCGAWQLVMQGAGTQNTINTGAGVSRPGLWRLSSTTATSTGALLIGSTGNANLQSGTYEYVFVFRVPTLATAGEDGEFMMGVSDNATFGSEFTTGNKIMIAVDRATDATHFVCAAVQAGVSTVRSASTTTVTAGTFYAGKIRLNLGGSAQLFIAPVGTPTAFSELSCDGTMTAGNLPGTNINLNSYAYVSKSVGTVNTLQLDIDVFTFFASSMPR